MAAVAKYRIRYAIFRTRWGYFGLAGTEKALLRTRLPVPSLEQAKHQLIGNYPQIQCDKSFLKELQGRIISYFDGGYVVFNKDIPIILGGLSKFAQQVLTTCRDVSYGQTRSYGQLARKAHRPGAARAVGLVMSRNPLPLIIPCHRVICSDGSIGGFSAIGGTRLKEKMLELEKACK